MSRTKEMICRIFSIQYLTYGIISRCWKVMMPNRANSRRTINRMRWNTKMKIWLRCCIIIMMYCCFVWLGRYWYREYWRNCRICKWIEIIGIIYCSRINDWSKNISREYLMNLTYRMVYQYFLMMINIVRLELIDVVSL